jgi:allophanate hydrolase subunit 2
VRGGLSPDPVLGSRSTDTLSGLGPVIRPGTTVPIGSDAAGPVPPVDAGPWGWISDPVDVAVLPGPRRDYLAPEALRALTATVWTVSPASDRVGMRLEGPPLARSRGDEVPSEPMVPGAVQVPPDGHPVVLLADGPVTGGYPVVAVVADGDRDTLGQALPGTRVRFHRSPGW